MKYIIFNRKIANALIKAGFPLIRIDDSNKEYKKVIFIFQNSVEFQEALKKISALLRKREQ